MIDRPRALVSDAGVAALRVATAASAVGTSGRTTSALTLREGPEESGKSWISLAEIPRRLARLPWVVPLLAVKAGRLTPRVRVKVICGR